VIWKSGVEVGADMYAKVIETAYKPSSLGVLTFLASLCKRNVFGEQIALALSQDK
jgi:hypothetical protein